MKDWLRAVVLGLVLGAGSSGAEGMERMDSEAARRYFTDLEVVDQEGKVHRFYSDLVQGKTVLINFAFASCRTACSPITANLAKVQRLLGPRVGKDVVMLTLTVDPARDTPEQLRRFATRFKVQQGWLFLTGSRENMSTLLKKLGGYTEKPEEHSVVLLLGNSVTGTWTKSIAMEPAESIAEAVRVVADESKMPSQTPAQSSSPLGASPL